MTPKAPAIPCSLPACKNTTKDASGRCYLHRRAGVRIKPMWGPPPPISSLTAEDLAEQPKLTVLEFTAGPNEFDPVVRSEEWHHPTSGELHRLDGPAQTTYRADGSMKEEKWFVGGRLHRDGDEPAAVGRFPDGSTYSETYYRNGKAHRDGGKVASTFASGQGAIDNYYRNGKLHRVDGPAIDRGGKPDPMTYYFRGRQYESAQSMYARLERLPEPELVAEFEQSERLGPLIAEGLSARAIAGAFATGVRTVEGVREVVNGSPPEWVRAWEEGRGG